MRRRGAGDDGAVPEHLLSLSVWMEENSSPDPGPAPAWWSPDREPYRVHEARIAWSKARRAWVRQCGGSIDMVNALYGPGYDPGPVDDPRRAAERERRLVEALAAPGARRE